MTQDEEIRRGRDAQRVLAEPMVKEAFEAISARIVDRMRSVDLANTQEQQAVIALYQAHCALRNHFETVIQTGQMAEITKATSADQRKRTRTL